MDELGKWFLEVFTAINGSGRLGPPAASRKRVGALLEQIGGEGILEMSAVLNVGDGKAMRKMAACQPDLGQRLNSAEPQKALDSYFADRADTFEPYRRFAARGLSLPPGSTMMSFASPGDTGCEEGEAWEKVFRILAGAGAKDNDQESGCL